MGWRDLDHSLERTLNHQPPEQPDKSDIDRDDIARLVRAFYANVREHPRLGPIFHRHVGETDADWAPHLAKIEAFWSNVMLSGREYRGNPMQVHLGVPGIEKSDFDSWLALFDETAHNSLPAEKARAFSILAHRIGQSLWMGLQRARTSDGPPVLSL